MRKTEDLPRICVGVDLHKMQFTVHAVSEETGGNGNNQTTTEYIRMETNERLSINENIKRLRKSNNCINKKSSKDCGCNAEQQGTI